MGYNPDQPIFADQYRFEPIGADWDRGRSGFTHIVYDMKNKRKGVLKRAEAASQQGSAGINNEAKALQLLRGMGVPELYEINKTNYAGKDYDYLVIEYIDGIRVEKEIIALG